MVDILLATYNGGKYLETQIMSILFQSYKKWNLYIHDDGSTDNTVEIILKFEMAYSNIHFVKDGVSHLGPAMNFMHLLDSSKSELVTFCDQDDLWLDNKLETLVNCFNGTDSTKPMVVYSQARDWYSDKSNLLGRLSSPCKHYSIKDSIFRNGGMQGCAGMFNAAMRDFINVKHEYVAMHDHVLMLAGIITGGIRYIDDVLFLYRQHDNNVTTHQPQNVWEFLQLLCNNSNIPVIEKSYYKGLLSFYKQYESHLSKSDKFFFHIYFDMPKKNKMARAYAIIRYGFPLRGSVFSLFNKNMLRSNYIR